MGQVGNVWPSGFVAVPGTGAGGGGGGALCPAPDEARLFVDGAEVLPVQVIGGGRTGAPAIEVEADQGSLILSTTGMGGEQQEAFLYLRSLVAGNGISLAHSSMKFRVYPPVDEGGPPTTDVTYVDAQLAGTLDVAEVTAEPGESICDTFDAIGQGTPTVRVSGAFHHVWAAPESGGGHSAAEEPAAA